MPPENYYDNLNKDKKRKELVAKTSYKAVCTKQLKSVVNADIHFIDNHLETKLYLN